MSQPRLVGTFLESTLCQMREAGIIGPKEHVQVKDVPGLGLMKRPTAHLQHAVVEKEVSSSESHGRSDFEVATSQDNPREHIKQSTSDAVLPEITVEHYPKFDTSQDGLSEVEPSKNRPSSSSLGSAAAMIALNVNGPESDAWLSLSRTELSWQSWEELDITDVNPTGASVPVQAPEEPQFPLTEGQPMSLTLDILPFVREERVFSEEYVPYRPAFTAEHERCQHMRQLAVEAMRPGLGFGTLTPSWSDNLLNAPAPGTVSPSWSEKLMNALNSLQQQQQAQAMESPPQQQVAPEAAPETVTPSWSENLMTEPNSLEQQQQTQSISSALYHPQLAVQSPPQQQVASGTALVAANHDEQMVQSEEELPAPRSQWWKQLFCCV